VQRFAAHARPVVATLFNWAQSLVQAPQLWTEVSEEHPASPSGDAGASARASRPESASASASPPSAGIVASDSAPPSADEPGKDGKHPTARAALAKTIER
jgi:hypothetical protein